MSGYKLGLVSFNEYMRAVAAANYRVEYSRPVGARQFMTEAHGGSMRTMIRDSICRFLLAEPLGDGHVTCTHALVIFNRLIGRFWMRIRVSTTLTQPLGLIVGCATNVEHRYGAVVAFLNSGPPDGMYAGQTGEFQVSMVSKWLRSHYDVARDHGITFRIASTLEDRYVPMIEHWATTFPWPLSRPFDPTDMERYISGSAAGDQLLADNPTMEEPVGDPEPFPIRIIFE